MASLIPFRYHSWELLTSLSARCLTFFTEPLPLKFETILPRRAIPDSRAEWRVAASMSLATVPPISEIFHYLAQLPITSPLDEVLQHRVPTVQNIKPFPPPALS